EIVFPFIPIVEAENGLWTGTKTNSWSNGKSFIPDFLSGFFKFTYVIVIIIKTGSKVYHSLIPIENGFLIDRLHKIYKSPPLFRTVLGYVVFRYIHPYISRFTDDFRLSRCNCRVDIHSRYVYPHVFFPERDPLICFLFVIDAAHIGKSYFAELSFFDSYLSGKQRLATVIFKIIICIVHA